MLLIFVLLFGMFLSIVATIYCSENTVNVLTENIVTECDKLQVPYEIIFIDDGSSDSSWMKIENLSKQIPVLKGIKLSRNFGQHYAISCGIEHAVGEWIFVMDGDLQDNPKEFKRFIDKTNEGFDVVVANRINRKDKFFKKIYSVVFWKLLSYLTGKPLHHSISNFGIYHKNAIHSVIRMRDYIRFFPTMINWVGYKKTSINVEHNARYEGNSTYSLNKMIRLAMDVIIVNSEKPLKLVIKTGFFISFISFIIGAAYFYRYITNEIQVPGYASIIISIWFLGGLIIFILGILGMYLSKTFDSVKNRPYYIIEKISP
ncbi:MAG: glycosyltransferase family 2 protein [Chitinophagales bacterium]|jgi:glycosyltransferase involved in cell wall biosynthesis|nr:glycosyltransferase family 2 protein [Chitinophagales bacterium]